MEDKECRICFDSDNEGELIVPCNCSGTSRYVHRTCLERWRRINVDKPAFTKCMECNELYTIMWGQPRESFYFADHLVDNALTFKKNISFIFFFLAAAILIKTMDRYLNYFSLTILLIPNTKEENTFKDLLISNSLCAVEYEYSLLIFLCSLMVFIKFAIHLTWKLKRPYLFWKKFTCFYFWIVTTSLHFYYMYWIFRNETKKMDVSLIESYLNIELVASSFMPILYKLLLMQSNNVIYIMNKGNYGYIVDRNEENITIDEPHIQQEWHDISIDISEEPTNETTEEVTTEMSTIENTID